MWPAQLFVKTYSYFYHVPTKAYSRLSLSRLRLSRITTFLEVKIWSLFLHGNLTTEQVTKYCGKEEKLLIRAISPLFHNIFNISLSSGVKLNIDLLNVVVYFFLTSANLICRGTDIKNYLRESLGLRDNESRLYVIVTH